MLGSGIVIVIKHENGQRQSIICVHNGSEFHLATRLCRLKSPNAWGKNKATRFLLQSD